MRPGCGTGRRALSLPAPQCFPRDLELVGLATQGALPDAAEVYTDLSAALIEDAATLREHMAEKVGEIPGRDLPGAIRNVLTGAAIATDKAATLRDEPTAIVQYRSLAEVVRKLEAMGVIEGEAEDVTDAEVVEPDAVGPGG